MFHSILSSLDGLVSWLQTLLYVDVVQPTLFKIGMMDYDEDTYDALYWVIVGVLEVLAMYAILRPLEAFRPAEEWKDRKGVARDCRLPHPWTLSSGDRRVDAGAEDDDRFSAKNCSWRRLLRHRRGMSDCDGLHVALYFSV